MSWPVDPADQWTAIAAIGTWAAVVAALFLSVWTFIREKAHREKLLKVRLSEGMVFDPDSQTTEHHLTIAVSNLAPHPVHVRGWALTLPRKRSIRGRHSLQPVRHRTYSHDSWVGSITGTVGDLKPGANVVYYDDISTIRAELRKGGYIGKVRVQAVVSDHKGHPCLSKPRRLEVPKA